MKTPEPQMTVCSPVCIERLAWALARVTANNATVEAVEIKQSK